MAKEVLFVSVDNLLSIDDFNQIDNTIGCKRILASLNADLFHALTKVSDWYIVLIKSVALQGIHVEESLTCVSENRVIDKIEVSENEADIATLISKWISNDGDVADYIILGDGVGMSSHSGHYIRIDQSKGLSRDIALKILEMRNSHRSSSLK